MTSANPGYELQVRREQIDPGHGAERAVRRPDRLGGARGDAPGEGEREHVHPAKFVDGEVVAAEKVDRRLPGALFGLIGSTVVVAAVIAIVGALVAGLAGAWRS